MELLRDVLPTYSHKSQESKHPNDVQTYWDVVYGEQVFFEVVFSVALVLVVAYREVYGDAVAAEEG